MLDFNEVNITYNKGADVITGADIMQALRNGCLAHGLDGLDGLCECSTSKYNNILMYVGKLFKDTKALHNTSQGLPYNITYLNILLDMYIYLCFEYNKGLDYIGLYNFIGLSQFVYNESNINGYNSDALNKWLVYARKRIDDADDILQHNNARDSKQAILQLAYNNHRHNWAGEIRSNEMRSACKTLEDIKRERLEMSTTDGQNQ